MKPENKNYGCSQQDLYSVLNTLWDNYLEDLADFTAYKQSYTAAKATAAKLAIKNAKKMPDDQARGSEAEQLRLDVADAADAVIGNFLQTKGYINGVFAEKKRKANYEEAGQKYYRGATEDDWESVSGMGASLNKYLTDNLALLQDGGNNMPVGFEVTVDGNVDAFELVYGKFKSASETSVATAKKIKANNACKTTARDMEDDGLVIYRKKPEYAERYIFDRILAMINPKVAGMKGTILNGNTNVGEEGVEIKMQLMSLADAAVKSSKAPIVTVSDADGNYEHTGIESGTYTVTISKVGFEPFTEVIVIKPGTVSTRDFPLQPK
ncbi:MAG: carboxypeptidase regulatory-like domain-containing protein [Bacteroidetes bacterium]|nr:carboxypeptidase regulatory-like domain-containing protein [Bacteroidota bacterium]